MNALLTDYYQLSMMQSYLENRMTETCVFELFVRRLPRNRNFLVAAGLEQVINYLESVQFTPEELSWLSESQKFKPSLIEYLKNFKFTGDVDAMKEGTIFFPNEPIIRITAPLPEAQFIESRLINLINFQTMIASKAVRSVLSAPDKTLVDFGFRRSHSSEAGLLAARASYIAGFSGTSTTMAGLHYQIPVYGTMAHSFIQAHSSEELAFENFLKTQVGPITLLIDTYNVEMGAAKVVELVSRLAIKGIRTDSMSVRIDSGSLEAHSKWVRQILDHGGMRDCKIFVSGNLDEYSIARLIKVGAPIDGFGIGTHMSTSADAPYLDSVYKIQEYAGLPKRKLAEGKETWPGKKQVYRHWSSKGLSSYFSYDTLNLEGESSDGEPLLQPVMRCGKRLHSVVPIQTIRQYLQEQLKFLPVHFKQLDEIKEKYEVEIASPLKNMTKKMDAEMNQLVCGTPIAMTKNIQEKGNFHGHNCSRCTF